MIKALTKYFLIITCVVCSGWTLLTASSDFQNENIYHSENAFSSAESDAFYFDHSFLIQSQDKHQNEISLFIESEKEEDENDRKHQKKQLITYYGIIAEFHGISKTCFFTDSHFFNQHNHTHTYSALNKCTVLQVFLI